MIRYAEIAGPTHPVTNLARSRTYEEVLGLHPTLLIEGIPSVKYQIGACTLAIGVNERWQPSRDGAVAALEVAGFDEAISHLKAQGIDFELGPLETPVCHMALIPDPDGSKIIVHKRNPGIAKL